MEPIKDEMFQALADETDIKTAEAFFGYILYEHHFQPNEIMDACPDFYEELSKYLEQDDWTIDSLKRFADSQFITYYNNISRRY